MTQRKTTRGSKKREIATNTSLDEICPLCNNCTVSDVRRTQDNAIYYNCNICGKYYISFSAKKWLEINYERVKDRIYLVSGFTKERNYLLNHIPKITDIEKVFTYKSVPKLGDLFFQYFKIVQYLALQNDYFGYKFKLAPDNDYPIAYAKDESEFLDVLRDLDKSGRIKLFSNNGWECAFTLKGHEAYEADRDSREIRLGACFVAMSFDKKYEHIYDGAIKPALVDTGYHPLRIDKKEFTEYIDNEILKGITTCRFMIADFTQHRNGVYFESGFAKGLGKEVIWTCSNDDLQQLHFDTRQFNFITWMRGQELYEKLVERILVLIG